MKEKETIIFDLDGVLWELDFVEFGRQIAKDLKIKEDLIEEFASKIPILVTTMLQKTTIMIDENVVLESIEESIEDLDKFGIDASKVYNCLINPKYNYCKNNPKALEVIKELSNRGYNLVVKSNWFSSVQVENLKRYGYYPYFKEVVGIMNDYMKPNPLSVSKLIKKQDPSNFIVVGDTPRKEMKLACNLGMKSIWLNEKQETKPQEEDMQATYEIHDITEILDILR